MKIIVFLSPTRIILLVFVVLILVVPVYFFYYEPERTNYLPGEKQTYHVKTKIYPGTFQEYAFHTDGRIDLLWGILVRNYVHNLLGPILVLVYYFLGSGLNWIFQRVRYKSNGSRKK